jgi:thiamine biosynthesis lipoprotein
LGTEFEAILCGSNPDFLRDAAYEALEEVHRVELRLSHTRPDSDLCDINARAPYVPVLLDPELWDLVRRARELHARSGGAFDIAVGSLIRLWSTCRREARLPEPGEVAAAMQKCGMHRVHADEATRTLRTDQPGVELNAGACGKGYAVDRAVEHLRGLGVESALLHGGTSTVYAIGAPPGAEAWEIGIRHPDEPGRRLGSVLLRNRALSTSGDYEQFFTLAGKRYSHILDPRIGWPATGVRSATVLCDNAADSDALSTAAFVLGWERGRALIDSTPGAALLMLDTDGGRDPQEVRLIGAVHWKAAVFDPAQEEAR